MTMKHIRLMNNARLKKYPLVLLSVLSLLTLSACKSKIDSVNAAMEEIDSEPALPIDAPPVFQQVPNYQYDAQHLRSPFIPASIANELKVSKSTSLRPNLKRQKQALEHYPLDQLRMKGRIVAANGQQVALIETPDGRVEQIGLQQYIGLNQGRVVSISATEIKVLELIQNGVGGYLERPRVLMLTEKEH